jgi:hypothetical protein
MALAKLAKQGLLCFHYHLIYTVHNRNESVELHEGATTTSDKRESVTLRDAKLQENYGGEVASACSCLLPRNGRPASTKVSTGFAARAARVAGCPSALLSLLFCRRVDKRCSFVYSSSLRVRFY